MNRRDFLLASSSCALTGISTTRRINNPVLGLKFEVSQTSDVSPSNIGTVLIDFTKLELTPLYLDEGQDLSLVAKVEISDSEDFHELNIGFENGKTYDVSDQIEPLTINPNESGEFLYGTITVSVEHPNVSDSYIRNFSITDSSTTVDNFEESLYESIGNSLSDYYSGSLSNFNRTTTRSYEGSYSINASSDGGSYNIISKSGLPSYPSQGDVIEIRYYAGGSGEPQQRFLWGVQDSNNHYGLEINNDSPDNVLYFRKDGNSVKTTTETGDKTPRNEWQRVIIYWNTDGTMTCELHNSNGSPDYSLEVSDTEYTSGGIGFNAGASGSGSSYWDSYRIK